jgi:hypothetical protein
MQKNRSTAADPQNAGATVTVQQLKALPTVPEPDGKMRADWPANLRDAITGHEGHAAVFNGYIVKAIAEGPESSNCGLPNPRDHDVHVYMTDSAGDRSVADAAIVEVTPRWRAVHPSWNADNLKAFADGTPVRLTGWLLYDQEHWPMIRSAERATLWEIHPVTRIQIYVKGGWVDLDQAAM